MEKLLLKTARQLNALDEASLMALWDRYMERVRNFDGSREWEESAIVLSLIQAVRGKNQLFNARWKDLHAAPEPEPEPLGEPFHKHPPIPSRERRRSEPKGTPAAVHAFRPLRKS
ncbi:MAG: hypothetical protein MJ061_01865 [Mailhella sp.]|nr:hypothetical protein [Mailhella sp.]